MIEKRTEELDELLFKTIQEFSINYNIEVDQDSDYENGTIKIKIKMK